MEEEAVVVAGVNEGKGEESAGAAVFVGDCAWAELIGESVWI